MPELSSAAFAANFRPNLAPQRSVSLVRNPWSLSTGISGQFPPESVVSLGWNTHAALATYGYDPFGRRIWKEVHGQRTYYHYSDQGLVAELDATGTLIKSYGYKPGSPWGTDP